MPVKHIKKNDPLAGETLVEIANRVIDYLKKYNSRAINPHAMSFTIEQDRYDVTTCSSPGHEYIVGRRVLRLVIEGDLVSDGLASVEIPSPVGRRGFRL